MRRSAHVGRQGMALLISGKGVLEDRLERDERHRCLRTHGRRLLWGGFLQYHANYPRRKRLVQRPSCRARHDAECSWNPNKCYRESGIVLAPTHCLSEVERSRVLRGELVLVPPAFLQSEQAQV